MSVCWLLLPFLLGGVGLPLGAATPAPAPTPGAALTRLALRVQLRTLAGTPVPGVTVALRPAPPDLGGPPVGTPAQGALTDATGGVTFTALGPWIWRVAFTGSYAGRPLQAVPAQGRPPYGTTPGDGLVVRVQAQEEHVTLDAAGQPSTPPVEVAAFVLIAVGPEWVPAIDLSLPTDRPQPLALPTVVAPSNARPAGGAAHDGATEGAEVGFDPFWIGLWLLPTLAAGVALWRARQRRRSLGQGVPTPAAAGNSAADDPPADYPF